MSLCNVRLAGGLNIKWQKSELDGYYVISHHAVCQDCTLQDLPDGALILKCPPALLSSELEPTTPACLPALLLAF